MTSDTVTAPGSKPSKSIYDRWLILRFTLAFVALAVFGAYNIYFQTHAARTNNKDSVPDHADVSASRAIRDFVFFIPGVSQGLLAFIVFGTTSTFRDKLLSLSNFKRKQTSRQGNGNNDYIIRTDEHLGTKPMNMSMDHRGSNTSNMSDLAMGQVISAAPDLREQDIDGLRGTARTTTT